MEEKKEYDVFCPLGYGYIRFVGSGSCPVSGRGQCAGCDVNPYDPEAKEHRVTRGRGERE